MTRHRQLERPRHAVPLLPAMLLCACGGQEAAQAPSAATTANAANAAEPAPPPILPAPVAPLDRAELLVAVRLAMDAAASGAPPPAGNKALVNRSFEIRLPFGCEGSSSIGTWAEVDHDVRRGVLRLAARPPLSGDDALLRAVAAGQRFDRAEGYWIERPWTNSEVCPPGATAADAREDTVRGTPRPTLAIAQFFAPDEPRTRQRGGRPYTVTRKLDADAIADRGGYRLVLAGRIAAFADGQPVRCRVDDAALPPVCAINARFTRVAFERALDGAPLAEWPR